MAEETKETKVKPKAKPASKPKIVVSSEVVAPVTPTAQNFKIAAQFKAKKDLDGDMVTVMCRYVGEGTSVVEALQNLKDENGEAYPKGLNTLVKVSVLEGPRRIDNLALSPQKAHQILELKDGVTFKRYFGF